VGPYSGREEIEEEIEEKVRRKKEEGKKQTGMVHKDK